MGCIELARIVAFLGLDKNFTESGIEAVWQVRLVDCGIGPGMRLLCGLLWCPAGPESFFWVYPGLPSWAIYVPPLRGWGLGDC